MTSVNRHNRAGEIPLTDFGEVLTRFKRGEPVILVDDPGRENEGDVVIAAEAVTPQVIAFLMREARGLICVSISHKLAEGLDLPLQVATNNSPFQTPFAVNIDARCVLPYGVTAKGRATTIAALLKADVVAGDFVSPGHIFPLIANEAGVLARNGHTEGVFDLVRLCGLKQVGVLCEVLNPDGTMARGEELVNFANKHSLAITSIEAIREYRIKKEIAVRPIGSCSGSVGTDYGDFKLHLFADDAGASEHFALVKGDVTEISVSNEAPPVRIHSECLTGDVFGSRRCDCGQQLARALELISSNGRGIILYLRQEGRGIGLGNKLLAYALQDNGMDTVEANLKLGFGADERDFAVAAHILRYLGVSRIKLITNNPQKEIALKQYGIEVSERIPLVVAPDPYNRGYLEAKRAKMGHLLPELNPRTEADNLREPNLD
jgi:3,4-dihydroxy 2-butanone 4-phosphate synthase/GTP cyclohydrolase II